MYLVNYCIISIVFSIQQLESKDAAVELKFLTNNIVLLPKQHLCALCLFHLTIRGEILQF